MSFFENYSTDNPQNTLDLQITIHMETVRVMSVLYFDTQILIAESKDLIAYDF